MPFFRLHKFLYLCAVKNMMRIIIKIGTLFIALVFLLGSTGISFYHHSCFSSNTHKTIVYPGLFKAAVSCCCGEALVAGGPASVDEAACCKSVTSLLKIRNGYLTAANNVVFAPEITVQHGIVCSLFPAGYQPEITAYPFFEFYSPPFTGKALVHFLHQIKVPSPSSLA